MSYRIFRRTSLQKNKDWPGGLEPLAVPMDKCRTFTTVATYEEAVAICTKRNNARPKKSPARELAGMYEFTEV